MRLLAGYEFGEMSGETRIKAGYRAKLYTVLEPSFETISLFLIGNS